MPPFCKVNTPFKRGNIVSDGKELFLVNHIFVKDGEYRLLIDDHLWDSESHLIKYCKEVSCKGYYKVK